MRAFIIAAVVLSISAYAGIVTSPSTPVAYTGDSGPVPVRTGTPLPVVIPGGVVVNNPSIGTIGATAPTSATQVGGVDGSGNLVSPLVIGGGLNTNSNITLFQGASPSASNNLPFRLTNGSTFYDGRDRNWSLTSSDTVTVVQPTGSSLHVAVDSSALPSGAATALNQTTGNSSLASIDSKLTAPLTVTGPLTDTQLRASAVPVSGPLTDTQLRASAVPVSAASLPLPSGAATETTLSAVSGKLPATIGQKAGAASLAVVLASDQAALPSSSRTPVTFVRNDYSSTAVTTGAYVQLIASTPSIATQMEIFDSSGQTLKIAFGAPGSEVDQFLVFPGGNGLKDVKVPASTRVSIRAVSASATSGEIDLNLSN